MRKIFEKCLKQRLVSFLDKHKVISDKQYGFRQGYSTSDAATELIKKIVKSMDKNKQFLPVFLDLARAFDTVDHPLLMLRLEAIGIRGRGAAHELFSNYPKNIRRQRVNLNKAVSSHKIINTGVPQGTVLGPILFIIYVNSLERVIGGYADLVAYADDTVVGSKLKAGSKHIEMLKLFLRKFRTGYIIAS